VIWEEARRTMITKLGWPEVTTEFRISAAQMAFPEAMVSGFESNIDRCTNDPKDRHILAAAIHAKAECILTMNAKHFKKADLSAWGITATHPVEYLKSLYDLAAGVVVSVQYRMAEIRKKDLIAILSRLSAGIPDLTRHVATDLGLDVPPYTPDSWRT
jgi:hypothetical protein